MTAACPLVDADTGAIRGVLNAVDCYARHFAQSGYERLTASQSPFQLWLTTLLVIYVAVLGYRMLFGAGGQRASELPLTGLKIGAVLALTANWATFQTLVFDLASRAPIEIARLATAPSGGLGAGLARDPVNGLQIAYDQIRLAAAAFGQAAGPQAAAHAGGEAAAAAALWSADQALFMSTAGLFSVAIAAVGVLTAVGPVFIALYLFAGTRGLFVGWVRALLVAALAPLAGWMAASLMLVVIAPNLAELARQRMSGLLDADTAAVTASVIFVFAAVQVGALAAGALIAVSFRLDRARRPAPQVASRPLQDDPASLAPVSRAGQLAQFLRRAEAGAMVNASFSSSTRPQSDPAWPAAGAALAARSNGWASVQVVRRPGVRSRDAFLGSGGR